jgi:hypothetical protein
MALLGLFKSKTQRQRLQTTRERFDPDRFDFDHDIRLNRYAVNLGLLNNTVYRLEANGGHRETILEETFDLDCTDETPLIGVYNPCRNIVDAYQNVFRGSFGQELKVDDKAGVRDVNPRLLDTETEEGPVRKLWKWSNLNTDKGLMQEWAANLGTVGLSLQPRNAAEPKDRRVSIRIDHPANIVGFNEDDRGNVTEVELKYNVMAWKAGSEQAPEEVEVREVYTKDARFKEVDGDNVLEPDEKRNELGVCPYVLLRHRDDGHEFGRWAYSGSEEIIHFLNWIITNQGHSVYEHAWPQWFAAASGPKPQEFPIGRKNLTYVRTDKDTPTPIFEPLVADMDQAGALAYVVELMTRLQERQPEIAIGNVKALAGQSGETIAKLLIPAEATVLRARAQYEHAVIRALQIGLSYGVVLNLWDLGTGMGSPEAADAAYEQGLEDFAFAERPALPPSTYDQIQQAKADEAPQASKFALAAQAQKLGVDEKTVLEIAGFDQKKIAEIQAAKSRDDVIPTEPL